MIKIFALLCICYSSHTVEVLLIFLNWHTTLTWRPWILTYKTRSGSSPAPSAEWPSSLPSPSSSWSWKLPGERTSREFWIIEWNVSVWNPRWKDSRDTALRLAVSKMGPSRRRGLANPQVRARSSQKKISKTLSNVFKLGAYFSRSYHCIPPVIDHIKLILHYIIIISNVKIINTNVLYPLHIRSTDIDFFTRRIQKRRLGEQWVGKTRVQVISCLTLKDVLRGWCFRIYGGAGSSSNKSDYSRGKDSLELCSSYWTTVRYLRSNRHLQRWRRGSIQKMIPQFFIVCKR